MTTLFKSLFESTHRMLRLRWRIGSRTRTRCNYSRRWRRIKTRAVPNMSVPSHLPPPLKTKSSKWSRSSLQHPLAAETTHWQRKTQWGARPRIGLRTWKTSPSKEETPALLGSLIKTSPSIKWTARNSRTPRSRWNRSCNFSRISRSPRILRSFVWNLRGSSSKN